MKRLSYTLVFLMVGGLAGYCIASLRSSDWNPGHGIANFYFALDGAEGPPHDTNSAQALLKRLLEIDVRFVPPEIKTAFYQYVSAVADEAQAEKDKKDIEVFRQKSKAARISLQKAGLE